MTTVFISHFNDRQHSIRTRFHECVLDLSIGAMGGDVAAWRKADDELLGLIKEHLNEERLGGSSFDMAVYHLLKYAKGGFDVYSYDAGASPGEHAQQEWLLGTDWLTPQLAVQIALYEFAETGDLARVKENLRDRVQTSLVEGKRFFGSDDTLLSALIKNDEGGRGCFVHVYSPFYANNGPSSSEFLKALPVHAQATFESLMARAFGKTANSAVTADQNAQSPRI